MTEARRGLLIAVLAAYTMLAAGTALTRQPYSDEGELASPAYTLVHRGYLAVIQWEHHRESRKAYWMPPGFFLIEALWQSVVGFGMVQLRLVSVMSGALVLFGVYSIVTALTQEATLSLVIVGLLGLDYSFLQLAGVGRCEMLTLALSVSAVAAYLTLRERSLPVAILVGHTLMAASALTHPVGTMLWFPALVGLQGYLDGKRHTPGGLCLMALPYLLGGIVWGAYILGNVPEFRSQFSEASLGMNRTAGFYNPMLAVKREVTERFLRYYGVRADATALVLLKIVLPLGYLIGLGGALLAPPARRNRFLRLAVVLFLAQFLVLAIAEGTKQFHYIVHVTPVLNMILGTVIWLAWRNRWLARPLVATGVAALLVLQVGPALFRISEDRYRQHFLPVLDHIRPYAARGDLLITQAEFAVPLGFPDNVISDSGYGWRRKDPPALMVVDEAVMESNVRGAQMTRPEMYDYLTREFPAEYAAVFRRGNYTVYRRRSDMAL